MEYRRRLLDRLTLAVDLPGEVMPAQPLIEIVGENRVLIENHLGIKGYNCCDINVKVKYGRVEVHGKNLSIEHVTKHQLVITGVIGNVSLVRGV